MKRASPRKQKSTIILGGHGLGDCILSLQCAPFVSGKVKSLISTRDEVYTPLEYAFGNYFDMKQVAEEYSEDNNILNSESVMGRFQMSELDMKKDFYYVIPDLLFKNPYAFDYEKHNTHPQIIKSTRLLTQDHKPEKIIYFGLLTTTAGYDYPEAKRLIELVAKKFKDYTIYLPSMDSWAGQKIKCVGAVDLPDNVYGDNNPKFEDSIDVLKKSSYFVGTCNGPSHLAYHYGVPRLILDPQYDKPAWIARWKEDYQESVSINTPAEMALKVIELNINIPQTCLIPRSMVANNFLEDWSQLLIFKY